MARIDTVTNFLTDVADSIRSKTGKSEPIACEDFDTEIASIQTGGGGTEKKTVFFYDYDGTLKNSYTKNEFLALNTLPANPTHEGLIAQGWNWDLEDAKNYVNTYDYLIIGQTYETNNGNTRIYITLENELSPYIQIGIKGEALVDWGDGTTSTITGSSLRTDYYAQHTYASVGSYVIEISSESTISIHGGAYGTKLITATVITTYGVNSLNDNKVYYSCVKRIELGNNVRLDDGSFGYLNKLETITIPIAITNLPYSYLFQECNSLKALILPKTAQGTCGGSTFLSNAYKLETLSLNRGITIIGMVSYGNFELITIPDTVTSLNGGFVQNSNLKKVVIPNSLTEGVNFNSDYSLEEINFPSTTRNISGYVANNNYALKSITIPSLVTNIQNYSFQNCMGLKTVTFEGEITTINQSAFQGCIRLEEITIPASVTTFSPNVFVDCKSLKKIKNYSNKLNNYLFGNCSNLETIEMDFTDLTLIPANCFQGCSSLKSLPFSEMNNVTMIGQSAFSACYSFNVDELNDNIITINASAFSGCIYLNLSKLPSSLTTLGSGAFAGCKNESLKTIPDGVSRLENNTFISNSFTQISMSNVTYIGGTSTTNGCFKLMPNIVAFWIGSAITNAGLLRYSLSSNNVANYKKIFINLPRATVQSFTNYTYAFCNSSSKQSIIVCNDDAGWLTKEEFDAIDWENYVEE